MPICSGSVRILASAMSRHGLRRLVAISTLGAGETRAHVGWLTRNVVFGFLPRREVADKEAMEQELAGTDLDWVVVRVGRLMDGPARRTWRAADDGSIRRKIARHDVATFMLDQLTSDTWLRRKPVVVY